MQNLLYKNDLEYPLLIYGDDNARKERVINELIKENGLHNVLNTTFVIDDHSCTKEILANETFPNVNCFKLFNEYKINEEIIINPCDIYFLNWKNLNSALSHKVDFLISFMYCAYGIVHPGKNCLWNGYIYGFLEECIRSVYHKKAEGILNKTDMPVFADITKEMKANLAKVTRADVYNEVSNLIRAIGSIAKIMPCLYTKTNVNFEIGSLNIFLLDSSGKLYGIKELYKLILTDCAIEYSFKYQSTTKVNLYSFGYSNRFSSLYLFLRYYKQILSADINFVNIVNPKEKIITEDYLKFEDHLKFSHDILIFGDITIEQLDKCFNLIKQNFDFPFADKNIGLHINKNNEIEKCILLQ